MCRGCRRCVGPGSSSLGAHTLSPGHHGLHGSRRDSPRFGKGALRADRGAGRPRGIGVCLEGSPGVTGAPRRQPYTPARNRGIWVPAAISPLPLRPRAQARTAIDRAGGADHVIPETIEASLQISELVLTGLGVPDRSASQIIKARRQIEQESWAGKSRKWRIE